MTARKSSRRKGSRRAGRQRSSRGRRSRQSPPPETGLLKLAASLIASEELQLAFNDDPEKVIGPFHLTAAERKAFYSMDPEVIAPVVEGQLTGFVTEVRGAKPMRIDPCNDDYTPDDGRLEIRYPSPVPGIYRVIPKRRKKWTIVGNKLDLKITGKSFCRDPEPSVKVRRLSDGAIWSLQEAELAGSFRCSRLTVTLIPHPDEETLEVDGYQFIVMNNSVPLERDRPSDQPDFEVY